MPSQHCFVYSLDAALQDHVAATLSRMYSFSIIVLVTVTLGVAVSMLGRTKTQCLVCNCLCCPFCPTIRKLLPTHATVVMTHNSYSQQEQHLHMIHAVHQEKKARQLQLAQHAQQAFKTFKVYCSLKTSLCICPTACKQPLTLQLTLTT